MRTLLNYRRRQQKLEIFCASGEYLATSRFYNQACPQKLLIASASISMAVTKPTILLAQPEEMSPQKSKTLKETYFSATLRKKKFEKIRSERKIASKLTKVHLVSYIP